ncbi:hypothetical protein VT06_06715 [Arsukibacterium sp. MJ3]|uniref:YggN family protein n=1 Tax=Arsukibacterium sp. MJ3 TaxID=1632859 RepID=UPI0006273183|nr:YggN family protein [Arsukibacterium sp. MJ3]KKO49515.1 hypothetical protein VT06_06715 [Arsukibacterium sp. MJ3]
MKTSLITTGFALTLLSSAVQAHNVNNSCNINFEKDLAITSQHVAITDNGTELWRINSDGKLWLAGKAVATDRDTRLLLRNYQAGIRTQTLETVALVEDALLLAADAVNSVLTELTGEPLESHPALQKALDKIKTSTEQVVVRSGDHIKVYGSRFDSMDEAFGKEFSQAIEEAVASSMGSVMLIIGKAMISGEGSFEQRMEAFGTKMERFGDNLAARMELKSAALEQRGNVMCSNLQALDAIESQIQQAVPQMKKYDLFDITQPQKTAFY